MRAGRGDDVDDVFFRGGQREATASTSEHKHAKADSFGNALALLVDDALAPRPKILSQAKKTSLTMLGLELPAVHVLLDELGAQNKLRPCFVELPASEVCVEEAVNVRVHRLMQIDVSPLLHEPVGAAVEVGADPACEATVAQTHGEGGIEAVVKAVTM